MTAYFYWDRGLYENALGHAQRQQTASGKESEAKTHEDRAHMYEKGAVAFAGIALRVKEPRVKAAAEATAWVASALAGIEHEKARAASEEARKIREQEQQRAAVDQKQRDEAKRFEDQLRQKGEDVIERRRNRDFSDYQDVEPSGGPWDDGTRYA